MGWPVQVRVPYVELTSHSSVADLPAAVNFKFDTDSKFDDRQWNKPLLLPVDTVPKHVAPSAQQGKSEDIVLLTKRIADLERQIDEHHTKNSSLQKDNETLRRQGTKCF